MNTNIMSVTYANRINITICQMQVTSTYIYLFDLSELKMYLTHRRISNSNYFLPVTVRIVDDIQSKKYYIDISWISVMLHDTYFLFQQNDWICTIDTHWERYTVDTKGHRPENRKWNRRQRTEIKKEEWLVLSMNPRTISVMKKMSVCQAKILSWLYKLFNLIEESSVWKTILLG
jgi:hypothetical protein